jgi:hypothetical protein
MHKPVSQFKSVFNISIINTNIFLRFWSDAPSRFCKTTTRHNFFEFPLYQPSSTWDSQFWRKVFGKLKKALNLSGSKLQVQLPLDQRYGVVVGDDQAAVKQCMAREMSKQRGSAAVARVSPQASRRRRGRVRQGRIYVSRGSEKKFLKWERIKII